MQAFPETAASLFCHLTQPNNTSRVPIFRCWPFSKAGFEIHLKSQNG